MLLFARNILTVNILTKTKKFYQRNSKEMFLKTSFKNIFSMIHPYMSCFCTEIVWTITKQVWHIVMYLLRAQVWPWFFIPFSDFFAIRDKRHTIYHTYPSAVDTLLHFQEMLKCNIHDLSCNYIAKMYGGGTTT